MVESIFAILSAALGIWNSKEKTKYLDRMMRLKREFYEENNKPEKERDHAVLDNLRFELQLLCEHASAAITGKQNP